jgi:hypothetical protein
VSDHQDPLALFGAAVAAVNAEDWAAAAALCDPVSLRAFHRQLLEQFAPRERQPPLTVDEYLRHAPEMPRAVAEYHVAQHERLADPGERLRRELPGIADAAALGALTPAQAFAAWLDGRSPRRQLARLAAEGRITPWAATLDAGGLGQFFRYVPLGAVADGDRVVHVLFRDAFDPEEAWTGEAAEWLAGRPPDEQALARELWGRGHPRVATCRRQPDGTWRLLADHDFLRIAAVHIADVRSAAPGEDPDPA